jgi:hypothetical protein
VILKAISPAIAIRAVLRPTRRFSQARPLSCYRKTINFWPGPFAYWLRAQLPIKQYGKGPTATQQLPTACLVLTIVIAANAEELLYCGYAIARLIDLTGSPITPDIPPTAGALGREAEFFDCRCLSSLLARNSHSCLA